MMFSLAAMPWLESATRPDVASDRREPEQQRDQRADERSEHEQEDEDRERDRDQPALPRPPLISLSSAFSVETPAD